MLPRLLMMTFYLGSVTSAKNPSSTNDNGMHQVLACLECSRIDYKTLMMNEPQSCCLQCCESVKGKDIQNLTQEIRKIILNTNSKTQLQISKLRRMINSHSTQITDLMDAQKLQATQLERIEDKMSILHNRSEEILKENSKTQDNISQLRDTLHHNSIQISNVVNKQKLQGTRLERIEDSMSNLHSEVKDIHDTIGNIKNHTKHIGTKIEFRTSSIGNIERSVINLGHAVDAVHVEEKETQNQIAGIDNKLNAIHSEMKDLSVEVALCIREDQLNVIISEHIDSGMFLVHIVQFEINF